MPKLVVHGAILTCSMGNAPSRLSVPATNKTYGSTGLPSANVADTKPNVNIAPFGMCASMSNPQVAAATAAAQGVLTPQPCAPQPIGPWTPGSTTIVVEGRPALSNACGLTCQWGGKIQVQSAGQEDVDVD